MTMKSEISQSNIATITLIVVLALTVINIALLIVLPSGGARHAVVLVDNLLVREGPGQWHTAKSKLKYGDIVIINKRSSLDTHNGYRDYWYEIQKPDSPTTGYCYGHYLKTFTHSQECENYLAEMKAFSVKLKGKWSCDFTGINSTENSLVNGYYTLTFPERNRVELIEFVDSRTNDSPESYSEKGRYTGHFRLEEGLIVVETSGKQTRNTFAPANSTRQQERTINIKLALGGNTLVEQSKGLRYNKKSL